jgi:hypothetical protein
MNRYVHPSRSLNHVHLISSLFHRATRHASHSVRAEHPQRAIYRQLGLVHELFSFCKFLRVLFESLLTADHPPRPHPPGQQIKRWTVRAAPTRWVIRRRREHEPSGLLEGYVSSSIKCLLDISVQVRAEDVCIEKSLSRVFLDVGRRGDQERGDNWPTEGRGHARCPAGGGRAFVCEPAGVGSSVSADDRSVCVALTRACPQDGRPPSESEMRDDTDERELYW